MKSSQTKYLSLQLSRKIQQKKKIVCFVALVEKERFILPSSYRHQRILHSYRWWYLAVPCYMPCQRWRSTCINVSFSQSFYPGFCQWYKLPWCQASIVPLLWVLKDTFEFVTCVSYEIAPISLQPTSSKFLDTVLYAKWHNMKIAAKSHRTQKNFTTVCILWW